MEMTSRDKKALMVLGAVALIALVFFVLHKGGSSSTSSSAPVTSTETTPPPAAPTPESSDSPSYHGRPQLNHLSFDGHDPFEPLVTITATSGTSDPSQVPSGSTTAPTDTSSPAPEPTGSPAPSPAPSPTP